MKTKQSFSYERFSTKTRFETEAHGKSEMTYWTVQSKQLGRQAGDYVAGGILRAIFDTE